MARLPLRPNVCMLLFNKKGKLFLAERFGRKGHWQFPQGGVDKKCPLKENVIRELMEELGLKRRHINVVTRLKSRNRYEFKDPPNYAKGKWRGQNQTFWLVEFLGEDSDIDFTRHEQELMAFRWGSVKQIKRWADKTRLKGYRGALKEFETFLKSRQKVGSPVVK